jgi:hypothetical protein
MLYEPRRGEPGCGRECGGGASPRPGWPIARVSPVVDNKNSYTANAQDNNKAVMSCKALSIT